MRRFQKATISDVAVKAGVSITTVSRFVSGREDVCSADTAARIRAAIADLHYTPSSMVSSVVRRATRTLGVCMYSPLDPELQFGGAFFERLWRGVVAQADREDYALLHYPVSVRDSLSTDPFLDGRVDGLLYHPSTPLRAPRGDSVRAARLAAAGMPTAILTQSVGLPDGCAAAFANEEGTANLALAHLWEQGHRRIAHIAGPTGHGADISMARLNGYRRWMQERGAHDPALEGFAESWHSVDRVADIVAGWRTGTTAPPTAVFTVNDALALAVIDAARAQGWSVPGDLSVVGVDNTPDAIAAGLTSVEPPMEEVGRASVRALLRLIEGAPIADCRIAVPVTRIVVRGSVVATPAAADAAIVL